LETIERDDSWPGIKPDEKQSRGEQNCVKSKCAIVLVRKGCDPCGCNRFTKPFMNPRPLSSHSFNARMKNPCFASSSHFLFEAEFCNPASGWEKRQIEKNVQDARHRLWHRVRRPEDDDRSTRSSHPPLPHPRNRKRQLPLQKQLSKSSQTRKGETAKLDEPLTQNLIKPGQFSMEIPGQISAEIDRALTGARFGTSLSP
jgi:hypothetical protein